MKKKMLSLVGMVAAMIGAIVYLGATSASVNAAGQDKVSICHMEGNGDFHIIAIADPAYDTHIAHGDFDVLTLFSDLDDDGFGAGEAIGIFCEVLPFTSLTDDDCDDDNADAFPGNSEVCDGADNDCDGATDEDLGTTTCGLGECEVTVGNCVGGVAQICSPGTPAADDSTCDGLDDDCDGTADEDFVSLATDCGVGACSASGSTSCVAGVETDSCVEGTPSAEVCDDVDNDCDGVVDDIPDTGCCIAAGTCAGAGCGSVDLRTACDSGSSVFQTIVEGGRVSVDPAHIAVPQGTSYITFNSNVTSVRLYNCDGRQLEIFASTNLCSLPGGCCSTIRWNDEICCIEVNP